MLSIRIGHQKHEKELNQFPDVDPIVESDDEELDAWIHEIMSLDFSDDEYEGRGTGEHMHDQLYFCGNGEWSVHECLRDPQLIALAPEMHQMSPHFRGMLAMRMGNSVMFGPPKASLFIRNCPYVAYHAIRNDPGTFYHFSQKIRSSPFFRVMYSGHPQCPVPFTIINVYAKGKSRITWTLHEIRIFWKKEDSDLVFKTWMFMLSSYYGQSQNLTNMELLHKTFRSYVMNPTVVLENRSLILENYEWSLRPVDEIFSTSDPRTLY